MTHVDDCDGCTMTHVDDFDLDFDGCSTCFLDFY